MSKKILRISASTLNTVQFCARKAQLSIVDNLESIHKAEQLERGDLIHKMLHPYYFGRIREVKEHHKTIKDESGKLIPHPYIPLWELTHKQLIDACVEIGRKISFTMDLDAEYRELCISNFINYCMYHAADGWRPLEVEVAFSKVIYEDEEIIILAEGIVDLVTDTLNGIVGVDHKTVGRRKDPLPLNNQFALYALVFDWRNIVVNTVGFQTTLSDKDKYQRYWIPFDTTWLDEWRVWAIWWTKMYDFYQTNNVWPPNFTSCDKFNGCVFIPVCKSRPDVRDIKKATLYKKSEPHSLYAKDASLEIV